MVSAHQDSTSLQIEPFLKWAGGKRWLLNGGEKIFPDNFNCYLEPFIGGAAAFFSIGERPFVISDTNKELIECYSAIRDDHKKVEHYLKIHHRLHCKDYYYQVRKSNPTKAHTRAAKFIYLNRTCWNGLYRVNLNGKFNVPKGTKSKVLLDTDDFQLVASRLKHGQIMCQDFEDTLRLAKPGDFVFVDPPYTVKHNHNGFIKYNENIFSWNDQVRLRDALVECAQRGVFITATNADHKSVRSLYSGICKIKKVKRSSKIAGSSIHRGITSEIIMRLGWGG